MALPKEPRQKMINLMYLVLTALLAMNVSSEILNAFKVVDKSLINSNLNLTNASSTLYKSLEEKLTDPKSAEMAKVWQPKAEQAHKLADEMDAYLNDLKKELKVESGLALVDGKETFKEDNLDAATRLFGDGEHGKKKGPELKQKLEDFKKAILAIDPEIKEKFEQNFPVDASPPIGQDGTKKDFTNAYFHMTPTVAALTILSKFQNNIKNAENQVASFCHSKIGEVKVRFDKFGVLVGQSSNYLMPGQELEVTAGVGAYSSAAAPQISIGGSSVAVIDGKGTYKTTVSGAGSRSIPVTIHYKDQNGVDQTATSEVKYVVGTPGGAAIMLDKMNVFYIGVPNPITISSGTGWDKTTVSMTGGTLSGSNGNRVVSVSTPGKATINVTADGKTSSFEFRVKEIPNPVFKVGPGGTRMASVAFKNQQFCRADLENFDFDARFSVVSATVYFSGANFGNVQTATLTGNNLSSLSAYMQRCGPGSAITFDNVKVQGPDGKQRTIQGVGIVLY
ncbi:gliding motility protein GldM [Ferruginibacter lapsinanis]|uniref:type IX secretion system motor protein PorM/GldM n=1 Tax=Ferruginibacter lapsinanis TaxID=563172 RepID=UPI001E416232|nr:gliding motility protein GldM [Ferruginibacter lapsinanis]UEG51158.1 gliding motility protein GldM [Ferruginibacter lapsinanis]